MQIGNHIAAPAALADAGHSAAGGIRDQLTRFERNVTEVAHPGDEAGIAGGTRDRALVEQLEIVQAVRANARSLAAANEAVGTIIDIKI